MPRIERDEIKALAKQHGIAPYSAKMVLKGKWTIEYALTLEKPEFNQGVKWMLQAKRKKWVMAFKTFERGIVFGKVLRIRRFNNLLLVKGKLQYLEKIETAYVFNGKIARLIEEYVQQDPAFTANGTPPAYKPSERQSVDLTAIEVRKAVRVVLYDGEVLEGFVSWVTEYDFELRLDRYISVLIFKHAVAAVTVKDYHKFRQPVREKNEASGRPPPRKSLFRTPSRPRYKPS